MSVRAAGATVRIVGDATPLGENLALNLAAGVVTELDFDGIVDVDVDGLVLSGRARTPDLYDGIDSAAPESSASVYFAGTGTLRVLNEPAPGGAP